jgi:hypothetical protein
MHVPPKKRLCIEQSAIFTKIGIFGTWEETESRLQFHSLVNETRFLLHPAARLSARSILEKKVLKKDIGLPPARTILLKTLDLRRTSVL